MKNGPFATGPAAPFSLASRMRTVIAVPAFILVLTVTCLVAVPLYILSLGTLRNYLICHLGRFIGMSMLRVLGVRLNIRYGGHDLNRQAVYIVNHSSTLDLFIIISLGLPRIRYVAKYELQFNPFFFILGRMTGQIFINRKDTEASVSELQKAYNRIRKGGLSILVAPEGSRKHEKPVGEFKKGAFRIAQDLSLPVVPVFIEGAVELCPGDSLLTHPGTVNVWFGKPVGFAGLDEDAFHDRIDELRSRYITWSNEGFDKMGTAD